jgi:hypothetical protein
VKNWIWVGLVGLVGFGLAGCVDAPLIDNGGCGDVFIDDDAGGPAEAGKDAAEELPPNPGGLPGRSPCVANGECAYNTCIPADNGMFDASFCFDRQQDGCNVVTWWAFNDECPRGDGNRVYVCGDSWDVSLLGDCDIVGTGLLGESYRCCANPTWP